MAPKNKETGTRQAKSKSVRNMNLSNDAESSEDDYRKKRDKNNQAVKKSRVKSRMRTQETMERVQKLKTENDMLEEKIKILSKELGFLKDLFLAHAGSSQNVNIEGVDLESLLSDTTSIIGSDHKNN
ncbi:CCAAT/enhancer-binding protein gamma [Planococcus citri]|uniref:CCAAT/enhancer-binding protein gamma n=1 Tax=Planococcus citri TaxID=170843 RepID=UPI0031F937E9